MRTTNTPGIFLLALPGAVVATVCDGFHVHTRTLSYPDPFLFGQAWWVFPGFLLAFLFMGYAYSFIAGLMPSVIPTRESFATGPRREALEAGMAFAFVYLLSAFGNNEPVLLSVIFYSAFAVRWLFSYDRSWLLLLSIIMAVGGMAAEGAMSSLGLVTYRHADVCYVPWWLGGLYMHGAFALREGLRCFAFKSRA